LRSEVVGKVVHHYSAGGGYTNFMIEKVKTGTTVPST